MPGPYPSPALVLAPLYEPHLAQPGTTWLGHSQSYTLFPFVCKP